MALLKILIFGQGRFGKLWGQCLMPLGSIQAYDPKISDNSNLYPLLETKEELHQAILECDVLFFCVPISELKTLLEELRIILEIRMQTFQAGKLSHTLWLMDTCSVKVQPMQWLQSAIPNTREQAAIRYLGLHPMFGPDSVPSSQSSLDLEGLRLVLCPPTEDEESNEKNSMRQDIERDISLWQKRFEQLKLCVIRMSGEAHDEEAACTQGLTHLLGRILQAFGTQESSIATTGYQALCELREQTCHDTWQLFLDLQHQNSYTPMMRSKLQEAFTEIYALLEKS